MSDETWDTRRLAGGLAEFWWACQGGDPTDAPAPNDGDLNLAATILASDWLAEHDARVRAEALAGVPEVIETVETSLGIRTEDGTLEPMTTGRTYDTRTTPLLKIRRTVRWTESVATDWEAVGDE